MHGHASWHGARYGMQPKRAPAQPHRLHQTVCCVDAHCIEPVAQRSLSHKRECRCLRNAVLDAVRYGRYSIEEWWEVSTASNGASSASTVSEDKCALGATSKSKRRKPENRVRELLEETSLAARKLDRRVLLAEKRRMREERVEKAEAVRGQRGTERHFSTFRAAAPGAARHWTRAEAACTR